MTRTGNLNYKSDILEYKERDEGNLKQQENGFGFAGVSARARGEAEPDQHLPAGRVSGRQASLYSIIIAGSSQVAAR